MTGASPPVRRHVWRNIFVGIGSVLVVLWVLGTVSSNSESGTSSGTTKIACVCAVELDDVGYVLSAYSNGDASALYGLISRGKAIDLEQGVKLHVSSQGGGVAGALVESGSHAGQHCWLLEKWIAPDAR